MTKPTLLPEEDGDTQGGQVLLHDVPAGLHHLNLLRSQVLVQVLSLGARAVKACHRLCVTHGSGFQCPTGFTCLKVRVTSACYCDNDVRFGFESSLKQIFLLFSFFFFFFVPRKQSQKVCSSLCCCCCFCCDSWIQSHSCSGLFGHLFFLVQISQCSHPLPNASNSKSPLPRNSRVGFLTHTCLILLLR